MATLMDPWVTTTETTYESLQGGALLAVGLVLLYGFRYAHLLPFENVTAGLLLGALLACIGLWGFIARFRSTVTVDPQAAQIVIVSETRFGRKERVVPFADIADARVAFLGRRRNIVLQTYYISLHLRNGERVPLFYPGFFEGRGNEFRAEERLRRLRGYIPAINMLRDGV